MAFKILYHEDALADLEEIFEWSREKHPDRDYLLDNSCDLGHTICSGGLNESYRRYQKVRNP